jgi:hypothetical protein
VEGKVASEATFTAALVTRPKTVAVAEAKA